LDKFCNFICILQTESPCCTFMVVTRNYFLGPSRKHEPWYTLAGANLRILYDDEYIHSSLCF
jgi:hypothetical protein